MVYAFARVSAVVSLKVEDYFFAPKTLVAAPEREVLVQISKKSAREPGRPRRKGVTRLPNRA